MNSSTPFFFGEGINTRVDPGAGDKVLWIHGYTMDSSLWPELWSYLPGWYHIGIDLPGHGGTSSSDGDFTLPTLARLIGIQALKHEVRHVIGLSFGAIVALQIATEFPQSFASLILGAAGLTGGSEDPHAESHYRELIRLYWQRGVGSWLTKLWMSWPPDIFKGASAHPQLWQKLASVIDRHQWTEMRNLLMVNLSQYKQVDHLDAIRQITAATLLVLGEEEMSAFKETAVLIQNTIPTCQRLSLPNAGHLCMLEIPEAASQVIATHLRQHSLTIAL